MVHNVEFSCSHISFVWLHGLNSLQWWLLTCPDLTNVVWFKNNIDRHEYPKQLQAHPAKKVKYPIPEIPDDSGKKSGTDWVLPKIIGSGRGSGTRQALIVRCKILPVHPPTRPMSRSARQKTKQQPHPTNSFEGGHFKESKQQKGSLRESDRTTFVDHNLVQACYSMGALVHLKIPIFPSLWFSPSIHFCQSTHLIHHSVVLLWVVKCTQLPSVFCINIRV